LDPSMHFHVYESVLCGFDQDSGVSAKLPRHWGVYPILNPRRAKFQKFR
jgi:hypothetical protein